MVTSPRVYFTHAYHAQPRCDGPGNYGRTSVNRFDIIDRIPFTKDFKFDMELWHWHATCCVDSPASNMATRTETSDTFTVTDANWEVLNPRAEKFTP